MTDPEPPSDPRPPTARACETPGARTRWWRKFRLSLRTRKRKAVLQQTIDDIIEKTTDSNGEDEEENPLIDPIERSMLANIFGLRRLTVYDIMVPRASIVDLPITADLQEVIATFSRSGHSRLPVYKDTRDEVVGILHIRDLLPRAFNANGSFDLAKVIRKALFAAPSMPAHDLLLEMRGERTHMALVVDEFGGTDGLVTIEDLIEEIVGKIEDEHDIPELPQNVLRPDGSILADARTTIEDFENQYAPLLSSQERSEDIDTLGGLIIALTGRVPARGERINHPNSGISFEVIQADPRSIKILKLHNLQPRLDTPKAKIPTPPSGAKTQATSG